MPPSKLIIETKLIAPQIKNRILVRQRLQDQIRKGLDRKLVLLCADAGYGKTTLLGQLARDLGKDCMYYTIDASDADMATFWSYMIAGIGRRLAKFGERVKDVINRTTDPRILVGTFINDFLAATDQAFYILLDDCHHLYLNSEINNSLEYLLKNQPANLHLVIASRATPPFVRPSHLTKQEVFSLEKRQLEFDAAEIGKLLRETYGMNIPGSEVERVEQHSAGWITAIQLILQKLVQAGEDRAKETLNGYVASGEDLFSYFGREVLENQPENIRRFLFGTSLLETMTPELCNRVLGIGNSAELLKKIEREHLFIASSSSDTYQYHPLFKDFILNRALKNSDRGAVQRRYSSIGSYYSARRQWPTAIDYFLKGKNYAAAGRALKKTFDALLQTCRFNRLQKWLAGFPVSLVNNDLGLLSLHAELMIHTLQMEKAHAYCRRLASLAKKKRNRKMLYRAHSGIARIRATAGDFRQALAFVKRNKKIKNVPVEEVIANLNLEGVCHIHRADFKAAEAAFNQARDRARKYRLLDTSYSLLNNIAIMQFTRGELDESLSTFKQILKLEGNFLMEPHIRSNIALVLIDLNRLDEARIHLARACAVSNTYANQRGYMVFLLSLGFYALERREYSKARRYFNRLIALASAAGEVLTEHRAQYGLMKAYGYLGECEKALKIAETLRARAGPNLGIRDHDLLLTQAYIEMKMDNFPAAEKSLQQALALVENSDFTYSLMRSYFYYAFYQWTVKEGRRAEEYLMRAVVLARRYGYDYFFLRMAHVDPAMYDFVYQIGSIREFIGSILNKIISRTRIRVGLFGGLRVSIDDRVVPDSAWETRKAQLLFGYLVVNRSRSITKEELMAQFAGQEKPTQADQVIRTTISRIHKALGVNWVIKYQRGSYRVNENADLTLDTEEFEHQLKNTIRDESRLADSEMAAARRALSIYRDDFMASFYDDWCENTRRRLREIFIRAAGLLARQLLKERDYEAAITLLRAVIEKDPYNVDGARDHVTALVKAGRTSQAKLFYDQFTTRYEREFNEKVLSEIDPSRKKLT